MTSPLFRPEAVNEKRNRLHGSVLLSQPLSLRTMSAAMVVVISAAMAFLFSFEFKRHETVRGYIAPSKGVVTVRSPRAGVLQEMSIRIGNQIAAGDELFRVASDIESHDGLTRRNQVVSTDKRLEEIEQQIELATRTAAQRIALLEEKRTQLQQSQRQVRTQLELKSQLVELAEVELTRLKQLEAKQFASEREQSLQTSTLLTQRADLESLRSDLSDIEARAALLDLELAGAPDNEARELSRLRMEKSELVGSRLEHQALGSIVVRAPVSGTITAIRAVAGQPVGTQAGIATLLPAGGELLATLLVPSRAIGFLEPGSEVQIRIDAFPFQRFGSKSGRIGAISLTTYRPGELRAPIAYSESVYRVSAHLDELQFDAFGNLHPIQPDMTLAADLILDRRTLVEWLMDPLLSARL